MKKYIIDLYTVKDSNPEGYNFDIDNQFFAMIDQQLIQNGKLSVKVVIQKNTTGFELKFIIKGVVELTCDRILQVFDFDIDCNEVIYFKYGSVEDQLSEDVYQILETQHEIDLSIYIYELIAVLVPMKKLHPSLQDANENDENDLLIYSTHQEEEEEEIKEEQNEVDPRWAALKNVKFD